MPDREITQEEVLGKVGEFFDHTEKLRLESLEKMKTIHLIKNRAQEKERDRLSAKLGPEHPRVKNLEARLTYNQGWFQALDNEIIKAGVQVPEVAPDQWLLHGRVLRKGIGVKGLTVTLADAQGRWLRPLGYACTDDRGYFTIIFPPQAEAAEEVSESQELFLTVSDRDHRVLYRDPEPCYCVIGEIVYREVELTDGEEVCSSPEPETPEPPSSDWVIKGRVTDRSSGEGVAGVKVSAYDKDFLFDDKLGETTTDAEGYFRIRYATADFRDLIEANPDVYLKVLNKQGQTLYSSELAVRYNAGREENFDIRIERPSQPKSAD
jgi:hypothetical protein